MGTPKILLLLFVGVFALGGVWYFTTHNDAEDVEMTDIDEQSSEDEMIDAEPVSGTGSIEALLALGRSLTCDFVAYTPETGGSVAGTMYLDNERVRGDFEMEQAGAIYESHMIIKNDMMYTWTYSAQGTFATQFDMSETETDSTGGEAATTDSTFSLEQDVEYDCRSWRVDESVFTQPADLEFQTIEERMKQSGASAGANCSACAQIADSSAQQQCLVALGCS